MISMAKSISNLAMLDSKAVSNDRDQCMRAALAPYRCVFSGMILALLRASAAFPFTLIKRMAQRVNSPTSPVG